VDADSGYGPWVRIYAPDVCVLTTVAKGQPIAKAGDACLNEAAAPVPAARLNFEEGTSYAAPLVAGIASLMRGVNPQWSLSQIRVAITSWGDEIKEKDGN
jgi:subtilisin family serine protease